MFDQPPQQQHIQYAFKKPLRLASFIKIAPSDRTDISYKNLVCSEDDKKLIFELITSLAHNNVFAILGIEPHLKAIGLQINHVHPLKFLATIFSNPELKSCMDDIFDDIFKRNGFMEGLAPNLTREATKGKLAPYVDDFCAEISLSPDTLRNFFGNKDLNSSDWSSRDWEKFVKFLISL